ncbi:MAG TPA: VOC family protein [Candidatus Dormibacteraeota bacterium]|nr:VOC family protein [Candidatus Dormibacteraeota bacterium]
MADNGHAPGTPIWVDMSSADPSASAAFYTALFGWTADEANEEYGGYRMLRQDGKMVAGLGPQMAPGPTVWTTYVKVADADATAAKVEAAGGKVLMAPMDVGPQGRMAIIQDPSGGVVGMWQTGEHKGAELFNTPVSVSWNELNTRDVEGSKGFYSQVFGWQPRTSGEGAQAYTEWLVDGRSVGGMMDITGRAPEAVPPHWLTYFAVTDCAATVEKAQSLGAQVFVPPMTIPQGKFAVLADPQGAAFAVIQLIQG